MAILVIADLPSTGSPLAASTLNAMAAARQIGGEVSALVAGHQVAAAAEATARVEGVARVLLADAPELAHQLPENLAPLIVRLVREKGYDHVLAAATSNGKNILPRVAALLDVDQISEITGVIDGDTFRRPIYAGSLVATVQSSAAVKVITVRPTAFDPVAVQGGNAVIEPVAGAAAAGLSTFVSEETPQSERPELTAAKIVISGGRGMQSKENFQVLYRLADKLDAAVGASLAAVDAGFAPNDIQVGQSGKVVAPTLYIAVGISGAVQHVAGMKDSRVIVAINLDKDAPIFEVADYGLVGDLFEILPELEKLL